MQATQRGQLVYRTQQRAKACLANAEKLKPRNVSEAPLRVAEQFMSPSGNASG